MTTDTKKTTKQPQNFADVFVTDTKFKWGLYELNSVLCKTPQSMKKALENADRDALWIVRQQGATIKLINAMVAKLDNVPCSTFGHLIAMEPVNSETAAALDGLFTTVIGVSEHSVKLPEEQLAEVLSAPIDDRSEVFIEGTLYRTHGLLVLVRGDFRRVTVPLSMFRPSGASTPDFDSFELDDYGNTVRFGEYESTAEAILWERDAQFRRMAKARRRNLDTSFGGSLRRLRLQKGLSQADFPHVSRRTIGRIETSGEKPRAITLNRIAKALGVHPDEIETY